MAANMWKNILKNVESDNNKILYKTFLEFFIQRNGTCFLNKSRGFLRVFCGVRYCNIIIIIITICLVMDLGHLLTRSGLTYLEVSSEV